MKWVFKIVAFLTGGILIVASIGSCSDGATDWFPIAAFAVFGAVLVYGSFKI